MIMNFNFSIISAAAFVPLIVGFIWYNPKFLGTAWIKASGLSSHQVSNKPKPIVFLWCYLLSFLIAFVMTPIVIHQFGFYSTLINEPGIGEPTSEVSIYIQEFFSKYGKNFRTFKHGALHGFMNALLFATPVIGTIALFEKKSFKYVLIHGGYWIVSLAIMGGIICKFA